MDGAVPFARRSPTKLPGGCQQRSLLLLRIQLHRHSEAVAYLHQRGIRSQALIEHMRIGYAPGRLWPRRGRDSLCGTLSPGEVLAGLGVAAPMARCRASVAGGGTFLSNPVASPQRGGWPICTNAESARRR